MKHIKALNPSTKQKQKTTPYFLQKAHIAEEMFLRLLKTSSRVDRRAENVRFAFNTTACVFLRRAGARKLS